MKVHIWTRLWVSDKAPGYPCPTCSDGKLKMSGDIEAKEPPYSADLHQHDAWEPDWITRRFRATLVCDEESCGELVYVVGDVDYNEQLDDEYGWYMASSYRPQAMFPAPPMIALPSNLPDAVEQGVKASFAVAWYDVNSAANRLRVSVERIMDDLGAPTEKATNVGKKVALDLNGRIQWFEKSLDKGKAHADTFHALRRVGNMGSHDSKLAWDDLLAALTVYEAALEDLYGESEALIAKAKAHLVKITTKK